MILWLDTMACVIRMNNSACCYNEGKSEPWGLCETCMHAYIKEAFWGWRPFHTYTYIHIHTHRKKHGAHLMMTIHSVAVVMKHPQHQVCRNTFLPVKNSWFVHVCVSMHACIQWWQHWWSIRMTRTRHASLHFEWWRSNAIFMYEFVCRYVCMCSVVAVIQHRQDQFVGGKMEELTLVQDICAYIER